MTAKPKGEARSWYAIKVAAKPDEPAEIMIYDEIGAWGISAADFARELKAIDAKEITLRINSPGGDVFAGLAMFNSIQSHPATVTAKIDGIAASAASLIAMAADKIVAPENAFLLIHEPWAMSMGTSADHLAMAADLERLTASFAGVYATRARQFPESVRALMAQDRLMTATEAKSLGYVDELTPALAAVAKFDPEKLPSKHRAAVIAAFGLSQTQESHMSDKIAAEAAAKAAEEAKLKAETEATAKVEAEAKAAAEAAAKAYGATEINFTMDLCKLARASLDTAQKFIAAKTPVEKVRADLVAAQAVASDRKEIDTTSPKAAVDAGWGAVMANVNKAFNIK